MKIVIFNVGGALSSYFEFSSKKILIDLGKSNDFNPIDDFLKPLFIKREELKKDKYLIDQLIISHPHNDHISAIKEFDSSFYADLLTCPNDNEGMKDEEKINWKLIDNPTDEYVKYLKDKMLPRRTPPLRSSNPTDLFIYYISPKNCETEKNFETKNYSNNISIAVYLRVNEYKIFLPGDLMKDGMEYIINKESSLRRRLGEGVDILIAPHHGLKSSFSQKLFDSMSGKKTRMLNIISEKISTEDSNRVVDSRYSSTDYCLGLNNFSTDKDKVCQKKTSNGHIFVDLGKSSNPNFEIIKENSDLIKKFL